MTVEIQPGEVVHAMDHLVLDLAGLDGSAYFTVYSLGIMRDVGPGVVALMRVTTPDGVIDRCFGETVALAERMQRRLRGLQSSRGGPPAVGIEDGPVEATIRPIPAPEGEMRWIVESEDQTVTAHWGAAEPAFWLSAPAPAFHPSRDYTAVMVGYRQAEVVVDGRAIEGSPYNHPVWEQRLGRLFSSCHAALAETAVEVR